VVSLIINHDEDLLRALADSGANSSKILENYVSKKLIRNAKRNTTTWSTMGGQFETVETRFATFQFQISISKSRFLGCFMWMIDPRNQLTYNMDLPGELYLISLTKQSPERLTLSH
jgi:hypothetical protein